MLRAVILAVLLAACGVSAAEAGPVRRAAGFVAGKAKAALVPVKLIKARRAGRGC